MPLNNLITFRKGTSTEWLNVDPILNNGEPGWDVTNNIFKIGDGVHHWTELSSLNNKTVRGSFLLNQSSGSFIVDGGYSVGALDVFLNGVKLSPSGDYTATDGSSFDLTESAPSGSLVEYLALSPGLSISTSNILNFDSGVSGLLPVKNIVAGTGISIQNSSGIFTIHSSGVASNSNSSSYSVTGYEILSNFKSTFNVDPSYTVGNLQVYYNGLKLLDGVDYTATDGSTFVLSSSGVTGDVVEWLGLSLSSGGGSSSIVNGSGNFTTLTVNDIPVSVSGHTHTSADITDFNTAVQQATPPDIGGMLYLWANFR